MQYSDAARILSYMDKDSDSDNLSDMEYILHLADAFVQSN